MDVNGETLGTGDSVHSTRAFDKAHIHVGVITKIGDNRITVRHRKSCCEVGRESDSEPRFWKRLYKRPTAWEKLLRNSDKD